MDSLLEKEDSYKPLFLVTACEELRVFGVYEQVTSRIRRMSGTVPGLLEEVLERLEDDFDKNLVRSALCFLECSRGGVLETEMLALLGNGETPITPFQWAPLYRSLQAFLRPPGEGEGVLDFFHR